MHPQYEMHLVDLGKEDTFYCGLSTGWITTRVEQTTCNACLIVFYRKELEKKKPYGKPDLSGQDHKYAEGFAAGVKQTEVKYSLKGFEPPPEVDRLNAEDFIRNNSEYTKDLKEHTKGIKHDQDKLRYDLMSPVANEGTAKVLTYGVKKYSDRNWEKGIAYSRLYRATLGHLSDFWRRDDIDSESNLRHLDHAAANIHMLQHLSIVGPKMDDRPKYDIKSNDGGVKTAPSVKDKETHYITYGSKHPVYHGEIEPNWLASSDISNVDCVFCLHEYIRTHA